MCSRKKGPRIGPESSVSGQHPTLASSVSIAADKTYRSHLSPRDKIWYCQKRRATAAGTRAPRAPGVWYTCVWVSHTSWGCYCVCLEEQTITADDDGFIFKCWKDTDDWAASLQWPADTKARFLSADRDNSSCTKRQILKKSTRTTYSSRKESTCWCSSFLF